MSLSTSRRDTDLLSDLGYPVYRRVFDEEDNFVTNLDRKLAEARMATPVELYLSRAITIGLLAGALLWVVGISIGYTLFVLGVIEVGVLIGFPGLDPTLIAIMEALRIPALVVVTGLVFGSIGFIAGFGSLTVVPYLRSSSREREINMLLPDAISFMYALSVGGLNQLEIIEAMARADDTYGEVAREFQSIVQETEYFDTDYRTAIREQSLQTPSDELSQFLTDMLSILNSGGNMTDFLDEKKEKHMRTAKQQQELTLETLELFGEMFITLSLFPLLLIIVLVVMSLLGEGDETFMYATVYGLIPIIGAGFLVLISTVKTDDPGDGYLEGGRSNDDGLVSLGEIDRYTRRFSVFARIRVREAIHILASILRRPHVFFRNHPLYTLGVTVPVALAAVGWTVTAGTAPLSLEGMKNDPVRGTFLYVYLPLYVTLVPLAVFHEWNARSRGAVISDLSDNLRKLSSANDTGLTLLESIRTVADTSSGRLSREFDTIYAKVQYGMSLRGALVEFNNKYRIPRLARTVKLVGKAQEASSRITRVLTTAAQASENQDELDRERKSRTRMQVVIILMTYLTLLAVMAILKSQFLDVMTGLTDQSASDGGASGGGGSLGGSVDAAALNMMFFHAVTIQAIISGTVAGYIRNADIKSGMKFVVVLQTLALATWIVVG
jgi:flagellar protein FlaJ